MARFLCAEDAQNLLRPPFTIYEGDKPDFWVMTCGRSVGIEVAEIVHEIEAEATTLASDKHLDIYFMPHPSEFPTRQSRKDLLQKMKKGGRAWVGSEPADLFAELACSLIVKKSEKHQSYAASDASLLLLYKNTGIPFSEDMFCESGACEKIAACAEAHRGQYERVAIWMGQNLRVF